MRLLTLTTLIAALALPAAAEQLQATMYKNPQCGCCEGHADHLRRNGIAVTEIPTHDLMVVKRQRGVPPQLAGCHTIVVGDYVVEGHVPYHLIRRLLAEKPAIKGISLPGMPQGSPGMPGPKTEPFIYYEIDAAQTPSASIPRVFARE